MNNLLRTLGAILTAILCVSPVCGQLNNPAENNEFFAEGKEWEMTHFFHNPYYMNREGAKKYQECRRIFVKVSGNGEIAGKLCKRLEISQEHKGQCDYCTFWRIPQEMYVREDQGRLYVYRPEDIILPYYDDDLDDQECMAIGYAKTPKIFEEIVNLENNDSNKSWWYIPEERNLEWINNVGWNFGLGNLNLYKFAIAPGGDYPFYMLVKCQQNGEPIYDRSEEFTSILDSTTVINNAVVEESDCIYYNLQGMRVEKLQKGEVYFSKGKKIVY